MLARRLGVRSPLGMAGAVVAASLPDTDVFVSWALHGDPWKMHRKGMHTFGFATSAGMAVGAAGLINGASSGERDRVADSMLGAALVGSHVLLDKLPFPYFNTKKKVAPDKLRRNIALNWLLDAAVYGYIAWRFWPRDGAHDPGR